LILFAQQVTGPAQMSLGFLPVTVQRNAYGRQVDSFVTPGRVIVPADLRGDLGCAESFATELVFIRAPRVTRIHDQVEVLAWHDRDPILVRRGAVLGASFHPELATDGGVMELFLGLTRQARARRCRPDEA
jgi:5'-phosphate synthase pdxT subunit